MNYIGVVVLNTPRLGESCVLNKYTWIIPAHSNRWFSE